ncbi:MAG: NAD(P)/FAD-dependent oxidoreductase [Candidatus Omnitrophota bacterium]
MDADYIIVGQGLAGTLLAYNLIKRNQSIIFIDNQHSTSSSAMCAGIINPITGKRLILTEDFAKYHQEADLTYRELEDKLNIKFFYEKEIIRFYDSHQEHKNWSERKDTIISAPYIKGYNPYGLYSRWFQDRYGSLIIKGNLCDAAALIKTFSDKIVQGKIICEPFEFSRLKISHDYVGYKNLRASKIIFCEGYKAGSNPYFQNLPFKHAKGDILTLSIDHLPLPDKIFNFGKWIFPLNDQTIKTGSTFYWSDINTQPTEEGKNEILNFLKPMIKFPFKVIDHQAGVRPVILDLAPVLGLHPRQTRVGIFNGLGAKGILYAPWLARHLAEHLVDGAPLESYININRFSI